ncbi:MAG TPA: hypothetical protein VIT23_08510 [Terrimicrobiaceae bacterium]
MKSLPDKTLKITLDRLAAAGIVLIELFVLTGWCGEVSSLTMRLPATLARA